MRQKGFVFLPVIIIIVLLGVMGYFVYQNTQSPVVVPTANLPKPSTIPDTTVWKIFQDKIDGYQVEYPGDKFQNCQFQGQIGISLSRGIEGTQCGEGEGYAQLSVNIESLETEGIIPAEPECYSFKSTPATVDNQKAVKYIPIFKPIPEGVVSPCRMTNAFESETIRYVVPYNGKKYIILFSGVDEVDVTKILSTFKFI